MIKVIEMYLEPADLGLIRFGVSPLQETVNSLSALARANDPVHGPWAREARGPVSALNLRLLPALCTGGSWVPDFLMQSPLQRIEEFHAEVGRVSATPPQVVRDNLTAAWQGRPLPACVERLYAEPAAVLPIVTDELVRYFEAVIEPVWHRIQALLVADLEYRAGRLLGGLERVFANLDDRITYRTDRLEIDLAHDCKHLLQGIGVLLVPAAFIYPRLAAIPDPPNAPMITYPARGIGELWLGLNGGPAGAEDWDDTPVGELVGKSRARLLARLDLPMTTTQLSGRLGISAGAVSEHLSILRRSELVVSHRSGREVFYRRTPLATALLTAGATEDKSRR